MLAQQARVAELDTLFPSTCGIVGNRAESVPVSLVHPPAPERVRDFNHFQHGFAQGFLRSAGPFQASLLSKHVGGWEVFRKLQLSEMLIWKEREMILPSLWEKEGGMLLG